MVALVSDVVLDLVFVETNGGDEISPCPQCSCGEFLGLFLEPHGCFSFQDLYDVRCRILRWDGEIEMYVLISDMPRVNMEVFPFCDVLELSFQFLFDVGILEYRAAVLGAPDHVVVTHPCCVCLFVETSIHGLYNHRWLVIRPTVIVSRASPLNARPS